MNKILIVEDEVIIAIDLQKKLESLGYQVMGIIYNGDLLTDKLTSSPPDLILLDINIEGTRNGIELAQIINDKFSIPFIYVTSYTDEKTLGEAKMTNPLGYVVKPFTLEDLKVELEMVKLRWSRKESSDILSFDSISKSYSISEREYEIILKIKEGLKNDEIASALFISENTVKSHLKRIYSKLGVRSRIELVNKMMSLK